MPVPPPPLKVVETEGIIENEKSKPLSLYTTIGDYCLMHSFFVL